MEVEQIETSSSSKNFQDLFKPAPKELHYSLNVDKLGYSKTQLFEIGQATVHPSDQPPSGIKDWLSGFKNLPNFRGRPILPNIQQPNLDIRNKSSEKVAVTPERSFKPNYESNQRKSKSDVSSFNVGNWRSRGVSEETVDKSHNTNDTTYNRPNLNEKNVDNNDSRKPRQKKGTDMWDTPTPISGGMKFGDDCEKNDSTSLVLSEDQAKGGFRPSNTAVDQRLQFEREREEILKQRREVTATKARATSSRIVPDSGPSDEGSFFRESDDFMMELQKENGQMSKPVPLGSPEPSSLNDLGGGLLGEESVVPPLFPSHRSLTAVELMRGDGIKPGTTDAFSSQINKPFSDPFGFSPFSSALPRDSSVLGLGLGSGLGLGFGSAIGLRPPESTGPSAVQPAPLFPGDSVFYDSKSNQLLSGSGVGLGLGFGLSVDLGGLGIGGIGKQVDDGLSLGIEDPFFSGGSPHEWVSDILDTSDFDVHKFPSNTSGSSTTGGAAGVGSQPHRGVGTSAHTNLKPNKESPAASSSNSTRPFPATNNSASRSLHITSQDVRNTTTASSVPSPRSQLSVSKTSQLSALLGIQSAEQQAPRDGRGGSNSQSRGWLNNSSSGLFSPSRVTNDAPKPTHLDALQAVSRNSERLMRSAQSHGPSYHATSSHTHRNPGPADSATRRYLGPAQSTGTGAKLPISVQSLFSAASKMDNGVIQEATRHSSTSDTGTSNASVSPNQKQNSKQVAAFKQGSKLHAPHAHLGLYQTSPSSASPKSSEDSPSDGKDGVSRKMNISATARSQLIRMQQQNKRVNERAPVLKIQQVGNDSMESKPAPMGIKIVIENKNASTGNQTGQRISVKDLFARAAASEESSTAFTAKSFNQESLA